MSAAWTLRLRAQPPLRVDARALQPAVLAGLDTAAIGHLPLACGQEALPLGELFDLTASATDAAPTLRLQGDLRRFDHLGHGLAEGRLDIDGDVGHHLGTAQRGGHIQLQGSAGDLAGAERSGGLLCVHGNVGDFAGGALPGSLDGMRGGDFIVTGSAGARLGDRMRRGNLLVLGDAGDFAASRLVAGTLLVGGALGMHPGWRQRRGTLVCSAAAWAAARGDGNPGFVASPGAYAVFWALFAREVLRLLGEVGLAGSLPAALQDLPRRTTRRLAGDLAAEGRGEVYTVQP